MNMPVFPSNTVQKKKQIKKLYMSKKTTKNTRELRKLRKNMFHPRIETSNKNKSFIFSAFMSQTNLVVILLEM